MRYLSDNAFKFSYAATQDYLLVHHIVSERFVNNMHYNSEYLKYLPLTWVVYFVNAKAGLI